MKTESSPLPDSSGNDSVLREPLLVDYLRLFTAAAIWGATFLCNEIALLDFSPAAIAAYRIILAALLLLMICYWRGQVVWFDRGTLGLLALIGILNSVVPFVLIGWGQQSIDSATTGILLASSPFATLVMSHFMTSDDRFAWNKVLGLVLGFAGVCVLLGQGIQQGVGSFTGMLAVMLAGCCYALASILIRRVGPVPGLVLAAGTLFCGAVVMLPYLLLFDAPWRQDYRAGTLWALAFLAVGPTAIGYVLRTRIVRVNGAVFMSNVGYLIPLFAVFWGWVFLSQKPGIAMLLSLCLILVGIALGQNRLRQWIWSGKSGT